MDEVVARKNPPSVNVPPQHFFGRVLKPAQMLDHARYSVPLEVAEELRPWVRRYWAVNWDLSRGERYQTATVSEPGINLTVEFGDLYRAHTTGPGIWLTGPVTTRRFDVGLFGRGGVVGVNFHLGGTLAFANRAPASIRDITVPAVDWFPGIGDYVDPDEATGAGEAKLNGSAADGEQTHAAHLRSLAEDLEASLLSLRPQMTDDYVRFQHVLDLLNEPTIICLGDLSSRCAMSERSLQRMFQEYCGVGVKKILTRSRVRDAVAAIDHGWSQSYAELAVRLGWFDQSHFTADFHRVTGYTPHEYRSAYDRRDQSRR